MEWHTTCPRKGNLGVGTNRQRKPQMKRITIFATLCALALGLTAPNALAVSLTTSSTQYLGFVNPGSPANAADEVGYINHLVFNMAPGATTPDTAGHDFTRSSNSCASCPTAVTTGGNQGAGPATSGIDVTGWTYLLAKYGNISYVWHVGGINTTVDLPTGLPGGNPARPTQNAGQSHYSLYNHTNVPDGGMTLMLLGGVLVGIETLRRKVRA